MMIFNLERWGDGTFRLVHWDAMRGDDIILELVAGAAHEHTWDKNGNKVVKEVDLVAFLENLGERVEKQGRK